MTDLIRQKDTLPLPSSVDGVLNVLRKVLAKPFVQSVLISETAILVDWLRSPEDGLFTEVKERSLIDVFNDMELTELDTRETSARGQLMEAEILLGLRGMVASHILCNTLDNLKNWLELGPYATIPRDPVNNVAVFGGFFIVETDQVPEHSLVVAGGKIRDMEIDNLLVGLRISIGERNGD